MSIDDFIDIEGLAKEVNKPDIQFEGAIESGEKIIRGENSPTEVNKFLRFYRQSLLGQDKQGHLFFGDLQSQLGREKFGIEDLKKILNAVNDSELWFEFSRYLIQEKKDCPDLLKLSTKTCIRESHVALEKAFLLAMPITNYEICDRESCGREFRVRNAIRNGLYELQLLFAQHNNHQLAHLEGKRDPQLSDFFGSSIAGLIRLVESAALDEFLRVLLLLWTDIACEFSATPKPKKQKQPSSDQQRQYAAYFYVIYKARNWFVHKQIKSIDALDVSFIFMVHARLLREGFADQYRGVLQYEQSLLNEFRRGKASSFKCKYDYARFSRLWAILGDIHLKEEYKKDVRKIYGEPEWEGFGNKSDKKAFFNIHKPNYEKHVKNGEFMKVLYRSFFRPDIKLNNCEYMKFFYQSFTDRADFKSDIVLKSMRVNFNE